MDPEVKDETNNCETEEIAKDSPPHNNNSVPNDGVKKVLNNVKEDDCVTSVDKEEEQISSDKCSETKNGMIDKSDDNEKQQNTVQDNNENHEVNDVGKKDSSSEAINNKDSESSKECEQNESKKSEGKEQTDNKNSEAESNASEPSDQKSEGESNCQSASDEKTMDVDVPADTNSEKDCVKDSVRPVDKDSTASSVDAPIENSSKTDSSNKETKDGSKSEVVNDETSVKEKKEKAKETDENAPSEGKTEHSKKDGETKKKKGKTCEECGVKKKLKFQVLFKGKTRFLCSDTCFKEFKSKQSQPKPPPETPAAPPPPPPPSEPEKAEKCGQCQKELSSDQSYYPVVGEVKPLCSEDCIKKYHTEHVPAKSCSQCKKVIENSQNPDILTWETMVFCNDDCLGKYQSYLGSHCTCCQSPVPQTSLGKYCVCFGADIRQFCSCSCLDDFKKNLKVCSFCQTDLSSGVDSFLAPVGDKGQFKDFCSQNCMERYEVMNNISKNTPQTQTCSHCKKQGSYKIQVKQDNETYALCGDLCVAGFRSSHKIKDKMCHTCFNFFNMYQEKSQEFSFKFDGQLKQFCTKACMTLFVLSHRKIVACVSCKVKKYNFDMIEKSDGNNQVQVFCSLNCLSLYRVSVNATSAKSVRCDNCTKNLPAQYHLTMSDGSIRNFCTYNCVMLFQNQYTNVCTLTTTSATRQTTSSVSTTTSKVSPAASTPVISNVVSLAPPVPRTPGQTIIRNIVPPKLVTTRPPLQPLAIIGSKPAATVTSSSTITNVAGQQVLREVIVKPPAPKSQKNKSVACKPIMQNKGINVKPQPCHKAVQTDDSPRPILLPVPVPYYVPVPIHMFSRPVPCPVPFPVPMFVPIVVPPKDSCSQGRISSGEKSLEKKDENSIRDSLKEGNNIQKENIEKSNQENLHSSYLTRADDQAGSSGTSDECNDANECEEDEYVFKDGKSHHHGKRHAQNKNKGHKKSKMDDAAVDDARSHNIVSVDENRNSTVSNDHLEPVPRLKVP